MSPAAVFSVVCVGETLWDVLPRGRFLGGAPLNVAAHLARQGVAASLVTRVGDDEAGRLAIAAARAYGVDTSTIQVDPTHATGEARATVDSTGSATYEFPSPAAWDFIAADSAALAALAGAQALVFGTLAQRAATSAASIRALLESARASRRCLCVFDPNLRAPHVDRDLTLAALRFADFVKLNEDECTLFGDWLACGPDPAGLRRALHDGYGVTSLCITRGAEGALLWQDGTWFEQPAFRCAVVDTVGAGDSFLAMLLAQRLRGATPQVALRAAAELAARVAARPGAVPDLDSTDAVSGP
jgi:fructokinase